MGAGGVPRGSPRREGDRDLQAGDSGTSCDLAYRWWRVGPSESQEAGGLCLTRTGRLTENRWVSVRLLQIGAMCAGSLPIQRRDFTQSVELEFFRQERTLLAPDVRRSF